MQQRNYNTIVRGIIAYSSDVFQMEIITEQTLRATEIDLWKRAAGILLPKRVINEKIRQTMEIPSSVRDDINNMTIDMATNE